jgi:hypothetical protein
MVRQIAVAIVFASALSSGCVSMGKWTVPEVSAKPSVEGDAAIGDANDPLPRIKAFLAGEGLASTPAQPGQAARFTSAWDNKIVFAPDPTHGGEPVPGLVTRLWVFGADQSVPLDPDGEILVAMWDNAPKTNGGSPVLLEVWHIDRETAKKFIRPDIIGNGYSVFLPSQKYHIDLKQINVQVRYNGADGRNLVSATQTLALDHSATLQRAAEKLGLKGVKDPGASAELPAPALRAWPEGGARK